jgi:hypothetical protein
MFNGSGSAELAKPLLDRACLSNSFVMLARLSTLMRLIMVTAPELYRPFARASSTLRTSSEEKSIERPYASIDDADFSHDVLAGIRSVSPSFRFEHVNGANSANQHGSSA